MTNKKRRRAIETFKVLVFNQRVIKYQAKDLLEKVKVWIVGEMKIAETLTATDSRKEYHPEVNCIIIDIENNRGISILESPTEQFRRF